MTDETDGDRVQIERGVTHVEGGTRMMIDLCTMYIEMKNGFRVVRLGAYGQRGAWRSTKHLPPGDDEWVIGRFFEDGKWVPTYPTTGKVLKEAPSLYVSWTPVPDHNDGTKPEDWA